MSAVQLRHPMLAAAPKPVAPECREPDFAPVTPETQAHMRMLQCFDVRMSNAEPFRTTFHRDADTGAAMARTLRDFARKSWPPTMALAGAMLAKHGDMARTRNLDGRLMDELSDTECRVDALLAMAGVPAAVQLEVVR